MSTERRQALEDWLEFVRGDAHIVRRHPAILLQQAANSPDNTAPAQAARQYRAAHPSRPLIIRTNKPRGRDACLMTITAHAKGVYACALSPDGRRVASASGDGTLKIWDIDSGIELLTLAGHTDIVHDCAFLGDGRYLVSASADRTLIIWDAGDGQPLRTLKGHDASIRCCAASRDDRLIVSGASDGTLRLWDAETGTELVNLTQPPRDAVTSLEPQLWIEGCAFSSDGRQVASCAGKTLTVFEIATRQERRAFTWQARPSRAVMESPEAAECCAFSPDGTRVVCGSGKGKRVSFGRTVSESYGELRIWDVGTGDHIRTIAAHGDVTSSVAWSPDGRWIASGDRDGTLKIWNADGAEASRLAAHTSSVTSCAFSADGRLLISSSWDGSLKIWMLQRAVDAGPGAEHIGVTTCRFSPGGERLLSGADDGTVVIWNGESGAHERTLRGYPDVISTIAVSPDSCTAAIGSGRIGANAQAQLRVWDLRSGNERYLHDWDEGGGVGTCAFTPDGRRVISSWVGWKNVELKLLSTGPPPVLQSFGKHARLALRLVVMGGGRVVATAAGGVLEAIDLDTGRVFAAAKGHRPLVVLPSGRSLICGSEGTSLAEWPLAGEPRIWATPHDRLGEWAISPDATRLVTTSGQPEDRTKDPPGEVALWDVITHRQLASARADSIVRHCAFSADGLYVVGCTSDGTLTIWDTASLSEVATYVPGGEYPAFDIAGERLALADSLGAIHLLQASGLPRGPAIVTAEYLYDFDAHAWRDSPSFLCGWCGMRLDVSSRVRASIPGGLATTDHLDDCSACRRPLRFNPFVVDWRDLAPPAPPEVGKGSQPELLAMQRRIVEALEMREEEPRKRWWEFWRG